MLSEAHHVDIWNVRSPFWSVGQVLFVSLVSEKNMFISPFRRCNLRVCLDASDERFGAVELFRFIPGVNFVQGAASGDGFQLFSEVDVQCGARKLINRM